MRCWLPSLSSARRVPTRKRPPATTSRAATTTPKKIRSRKPSFSTAARSTRTRSTGEARKKLGLAQLKAGNAKAALNQLVRAADLLPEDAEAQIAAGNILLRARQFEDAGARADRALAKDPKNVNAHILKANAAAGLKDLDGAITELEEAISLDPTNTASYANLGAIEASRGRHKEAEGIFLKAIEVAPKSVEPRLAIANYYWAVGRGADAEGALKAVLGIDAKNVAANRALGMFQLVSGNHQAAEAHFKAVVDNTTDPGPRLMLADFYVMRKRPQEATALLEELAKQPAAFADATARLAGLAYIAGDKPKAHAMIDSVIAKQPANIRMLYAKGHLAPPRESGRRGPESRRHSAEGSAGIDPGASPCRYRADAEGPVRRGDRGVSAGRQDQPQGLCGAAGTRAPS